MADIPAAQVDVRQQSAAPISIRRILGLVHLWIGVTFCIPFVLLGLTGTILMLDHELPSQFTPDAAAANSKSIAEIVAAAKAVAPEGSVPVNFDVPAKAGERAAVRFAGTGRPGALTRVLVDPMTLDTKVDQAPGPGGPPTLRASDGSLDIMRVIHELHSRMLIDFPAGRTVVGWLGVFMCGLGLSGIVLWWPKSGQWRSAFRFRFGQSAVRVNREIHGAVGIWAWLVFLTVCFSGVYIVFPQAINSVLGAGAAVRDPRTQQVVVTPIADASPADADAAAALAREAVPGGVVRSIALPANDTQPYRVMLSRDGDYNGASRPLVIVDQWQKKVVATRDPSTYSVVDRFLVAQRQLHAGNGLGWWWWIPVLLSGFLPLLFVCTGISMWLLKRRNKKRVAAQS